MTQTARTKQEVDMDMSGAKGVPIGTLLTLLSGGANIYPAEIEAAIEQHPSVRSCVVVGLPDDDMGQVTHAIIDIADPVASPLDTDALLLFLRDRLVPYKLPRSCEFVSAALRDDAGKVRRSQLRDARIARAGR